MWVVSYCNQIISYTCILRLFTSTTSFDTYRYFVATLISSVITAALVTVVVVIVVEAVDDVVGDNGAFDERDRKWPYHHYYHCHCYQQYYHNPSQWH